MERTAVKTKRKENTGRKAASKNSLGLLTGVLVAAITLIVLGGAVFAYCVHLVNSQDGIYEGVDIDGVDVSGLSRREAVSLLESRMGAVADNLTFDVIAGDYKYTVTPSDLGLKYDAGAAAAKAYNYGRDGGFMDSLRAVYKAKTKGCSIPFSYTYDTDKVNELSAKIAKDISSMPTETKYEVNGNDVVITLCSAGVTVNANEVRTLIQQRLEATDGDINIGEGKDEKADVDLEKIKNEVDKAPVNAYVDETDPENPFVVPSENGVSFSIEKARRMLSGTGEGSTGNVYKIPLDVIEPEVKTEDVVFYTYKDLISTATTYLNPGLANRTSNIALACSKIDGLILLPGDEFSFNKVVGERTYKAGFKDAAIYLAGEIADGVGGGICQVSSTLYMSAVFADLQITARKNHRYTVTYTKLGQDATVSYDVGVDMKFVNDRDTAIKIKIVQESDYVKCEIFGTFEPGEENKKVTMESVTKDSKAFDTVYVVDDTVPVNTQKLKNGGYTGYTVETYRVVTMDGKEVSRSLENKSTYTKLDKVYQINSVNAVTDADGKTVYSEYVEPVTPGPEITPPWVIGDDPDDGGDDDSGGNSGSPFWLE